MPTSIWHYKDICKQDDVIVYVFLDDKLRYEKRNDYLIRLEKQFEGYSQEKFFSTQIRFGTLAIAAPKNMTISAQDVYKGYKARMQVENAFDAFKNVLEADRTYARSQASCESWMFFNHIALMFLYDLYRKLSEVDLSSHYSPKSEKPRKLEELLHKL